MFLIEYYHLGIRGEPAFLEKVQRVRIRGVAESFARTWVLQNYMSRSVVRRARDMKPVYVIGHKLINGHVRLQEVGYLK